MRGVRWQTEMIHRLAIERPPFRWNLSVLRSREDSYVEARGTHQVQCVAMSDHPGVQAIIKLDAAVADGIFEMNVENSQGRIFGDLCESQVMRCNDANRLPCQ